MRRPYRFLLIGVGVILFLVISGLLARALTVGGAESTALTDLVRAEAAGDRATVIADIQGCSSDPACQARATALVAALRHPGAVQIAEINQSAGFSLGTTVGTARVAWVAGGSLPRVQCVRVKHAGNVLDGFHVQLLKVSLRIRSSADCPKTY